MYTNNQCIETAISTYRYSLYITFINISLEIPMIRYLKQNNNPPRGISGSFFCFYEEILNFM
jgi:hypothetical protein